MAEAYVKNKTSSLLGWLLTNPTISENLPVLSTLKSLTWLKSNFDIALDLPNPKFSSRMRNAPKTSMHSSRMRTARLLPVSPSLHCAGGSAPGGCLLLRVGSVPGGSASFQGGVSQHAMGQTSPL